MTTNFKPTFTPLQSCPVQVALHRNPKGVIQFIGSFIFGSFPHWSYQYLLEYLYNQGYSLILYRFPYNPLQFNHWQVALDLLQQQHQTQKELAKLFHQTAGAFYTDPRHYFWLGHSLGCKYIILLEILSNAAPRRAEVLKGTLGEAAAPLLAQLKQRFGDQACIRDQPSLLLAPEISNTVRLLTSSLRVSNPLTQPNQKQTEAMIQASQELFNLMGMISFSWDLIAEDDVTLLLKQLQLRQFQPPQYLQTQGGHFEPLSIYTQELAEQIDHAFNQLRQR
jgi:hypothetical protein